MKQLQAKKGLSMADAPSIVMIVGFVFLLMATIAYVSEKYGDALTAGGTAQNITKELNTQLSDNTDIAGILLTIGLVGIILGVLIGVFAGFRGQGM